MADKPQIYVNTLTAEQMAQCRTLLEERGWTLDKIPYSRWRAKKEKTTVVAYESGKFTASGAGFVDFVQFILEPEILHEARFGYETELAQLEDPRMFEPHAGIDESGKGDFLGSLCVACCYTDKACAEELLRAGVADSKTIKTDAKMKELDALIRRRCAGHFSVIVLKPETYNRLYASFGNLNRLLAWGHAKSLENVLEMVPGCPRAISDQFAASKTVVQHALQERGRQIVLEQHPKAEADVAVAAASILARAEFVRQMEWLGMETKAAGIDGPLPKGGGPAATAFARRICEKLGSEALGQFAKLHFKNAQEIPGLLD